MNSNFFNIYVKAIQLSDNKNQVRKLKKSKLFKFYFNSKKVVKRTSEKSGKKLMIYRVKKLVKDCEKLIKKN